MTKLSGGRTIAVTRANTEMILVNRLDRLLSDRGGRHEGFDQGRGLEKTLKDQPFSNGRRGIQASHSQKRSLKKL